MLILLPPSEKKKPATGPANFELSKLSFAAELTSARKINLGNFDALQTSPAFEIYAGVLYQGLDFQSLSANALKTANSKVLIVSALFGLVKPLDQIFSYKRKIDNNLWRGPIAEVAKKFANELVIDCRSSTYKGVWPINPAHTVEVRVFKIVDGERSVITHMSKKYRGELTRHLLQQEIQPITPAELQQITAELFECELYPPIDGLPWTLDLLIS